MQLPGELALAQLLAQIAGNAGIIISGMGKRLLRQRHTRVCLDRAVLTQLCKHRRVTGRVDDNSDIVEVLCRRPNHRRTANIDIFDRFGQRHALLGNRLPEGV